jgi:predicted permease
MYAELVSIIFPVLVCVAIGFYWGRFGTGFNREFVTQVVMNVGAPCMILDGMNVLSASSSDFFLSIGIALALIAFCALAGGVLLKATGQPLRSYLPPVMYGNVGNLGLPLCFFAFGREGLGLAIGFYVAGAVSKFVIVPMMQGHEAAWKTLLKTPIVYAALLGSALLITGTKLPIALGNTVQLLGGLAVPLMLLALGVSLGSFRVDNLRASMWMSVLRLGLGFCAALLAVELLDLEGTLRGVVIIEATMPVAVFNYLLASRYERHPADVAGAIVVSTLATLLVLPVLLLFAIGSL